MEKELLEQKLGAEGTLEIKLEDGKLKLVVGYDGKGAGASVGLHLAPDYFLDKLAAAIPGGIDDAIINILKAALKI